MTNKEHIEAANALIEWFNSQGISPSDANLVMCKVWAKLLTSATPLDQLPGKMKEHQDALFRALYERVLK